MNKIQSLEELSKIIIKLKKNKKKISLCHGVFDLLHPGHINHFAQAKKKADILVVSLTSDRFVLKGPGRPYFKENLRLQSVASLEVVDYVLISDQKSSLQIIKRLKPDFYFKGSDYKIQKDDLTGKIELEKKEVKKNGGKIVFTSGISFSSSKIINKEFFFSKEQSVFLYKLKKKYSNQEIIKTIDLIKKNIPLVMGEAIIDDYIFCKAIGKSGKEPYMVMQEKKSEKYLGGVLSIAQNLGEFSKQVNLLTLIGSKENYKKKIKRELKKNINFDYIEKKNSPTILKKRFIEEVDNNKLLGIYSINDDQLDQNEQDLFLKKYNKHDKNSNLTIITDYGHGLFNEKIINEISKKKNFLAINAQVNSFNLGYHNISKYKKADLMLMNETEARHELRDKSSDRSDLIKKLSKKIKSKFIAITHGKNGASIYSSKNKKLVRVPAFARNVVDKVGAGDALFPILAICLKSNIPTEIAIFIASVSAAINAENYASKNILNLNYLKKYLEHMLK